MAQFAQPFDAKAVTARLPDFGAANAALLVELPSRVKRWLPGGRFDGDEYVVKNPRRDDRRPGSFRINVVTGRWADFAVGERGGDPISLYAYIFGETQMGALHSLSSDEPNTVGRIITTAKAAKPANGVNPNEEAARRLYQAASSVAGTAGETYLRSRSLSPSPGWDVLRFDLLPYRGSGRHPVLIAPVTDRNGHLSGIQRTYLDDNGRKLTVPDPKLSLGRVRGGAIRLGEPQDELIVCEGLEDGLTLLQRMEAPVWVAAGAGMMSAVVLPVAVRRVIVAADNDQAGEAAARSAAAAFSTIGKEVRIIRPVAGTKDFNQELMERLS